MPVPDFQTLMLPLLRVCADGRHDARPFLAQEFALSESELAETAAKVSSKIVLIDGPTLADLMIDFGLGVSTVNTYEIKRIDSDFFVED